MQRYRDLQEESVVDDESDECGLTISNQSIASHKHDSASAQQMPAFLQ